MSDVGDRLLRCFAAVFPDMPQGELARASSETTASWNSLSAVMLVAVVEEEFGLSIAPMELAELDSFQAIRDYISKKLDLARSEVE